VDVDFREREIMRNVMRSKEENWKESSGAEL